MVPAHAAAVVRDAGSASELTQGQYENAAVQATLVDIVDQSGQRLVHEGSTPAHSFGHVPARLGIGVVVPTEIDGAVLLRGQGIDRDDRGAGFGEAARQ